MNAPIEVTDVLERLGQHMPMRVWSVAVTVFGDVVSLRGGRISAGQLIEIMAILGIGESAVRTALSRISKEGWVSGQREGRSSTYGLGTKGQADFGHAARIIYAPPDGQGPEHVRIAIPAPGPRREWLDQMRRVGALPFGDAAALWPQAPLPADATLVEAAPFTVPDWAEPRIFPEEHRQALSAIMGAFERVDPESLDSRAALGVRIALIHSWRRIRLRRPPLPEGMHPEDWPEAACHRLVAQLYPQLAPVSEGWWTQPLTDASHDILLKRFHTYVTESSTSRENCDN